MKIALIGNMNNNNFSIMRYFRDLGADAHLLIYSNDGVGSLSHFTPESDTFNIEKWQAFIHKTDIENGPSSVLFRMAWWGYYIELSLMIANKGIIITYGEFGQKRYKRIDYVEHRYNIDTLKKFNIDKIIKETCKLGLRHKKKLTPIKILDSRKMIYRVYYKITPTPKTPTSKNNKL